MVEKCIGFNLIVLNGFRFMSFILRLIELECCTRTLIRFVAREKIYEKINKDFCVFIYLRYSSTYTSNKPQCVCSFFFVLYVRVRMYILYGLGWVFREIWPWKNVYDILPPATKGNKNETTIFIYRPFYLYSV